jgi:hypothetical protein
MRCRARTSDKTSEDWGFSEIALGVFCGPAPIQRLSVVEYIVDSSEPVVLLSAPVAVLSAAPADGQPVV